jgi:hypothetical protein
VDKPGNIVSYSHVPEGGQTWKRCFLVIFPEGGQTRKHCFLAMFPEGGHISKHHAWEPKYVSYFL